MSNTVSLGKKKKAFSSIRLAAEASGVPYMTFYMRLRMGLKAGEAMKKPVRKYQKQEVAQDDQQRNDCGSGCIFP